MRKIWMFAVCFLVTTFVNVLVKPSEVKAIEFSLNYNIEERQFIVKSWTGINGAWPVWDLPKFCHIESWISNNYEGGAWKNHYVREMLLRES